MGQNQGKAETHSPPVVDIEHSSIEPEHDAGTDNKQKDIFMVGSNEMTTEQKEWSKCS